MSQNPREKSLSQRIKQAAKRSLDLTKKRFRNDPGTNNFNAVDEKSERNEKKKLLIKRTCVKK